MTFKRVPSAFPRLSPPLRALVLGLAVFGGAPGCGPVPAGGTPEAMEARGEALRVANSLTTQALVFNALTTNPTALPLLTGSGLQNMFYPLGGPTKYLQQQLKDPDARQLMAYLVSCALDASTQVAWVEPGGDPHAPHVWTGQLGLCPEWKTGAPSQGCENRVSACLLARNNALGRHVELSLRGEDPSRPALFSLAPATPPEEYDPNTDAHLPSFLGCTTPSVGTGRDCGWTGDGLGRCVPGQRVRLGAGARAPDQCTTGAILGSTSGARMMLRACEDTTGCDASSSRWLDESAGACGTNQAALSFVCPASGYFSVMKQAYDSTQTGTVTVGVETGTSAATRYPLTEAEVYGVREGAYYGNIFDPQALGAKVHVDGKGEVQGKGQVVQGSVYRKMYACQAPGWSSAAAYASHRLCALPSSGANCAAIPTGTCVDPTAPTSASASRCASADGALVAGDLDYEKCLDPAGTAWAEPITVFLHDACELVQPDRESCQRNDEPSKQTR